MLSRYGKDYTEEQDIFEENEADPQANPSSPYLPKLSCQTLCINSPICHRNLTLSITPSLSMITTTLSQALPAQLRAMLVLLDPLPHSAMLALPPLRYLVSRSYIMLQKCLLCLNHSWQMFQQKLIICFHLNFLTNLCMSIKIQLLHVLSRGSNLMK